MTGAGLERVAVALDTGEWSTFCSWCRWFGPRVGVLKVGLEAFVRWGPAAVDEARQHARRLFLDLKLHDIPATVAGAVRSARQLGADLMTLHTSGGRPMLEAAVSASAGTVDLLGVTVLTHLDEAVLEELALPGSAGERVRAWAELARRAGCSGVVCSALELERLRVALPRPFLLVTPGIRPAGDGADDQRRVATAEQALTWGADLLVIGRPLTRAADPERALEELGRGLSALGSAGEPDEPG